MKTQVFLLTLLTAASSGFGLDYKKDILPIMKDHCWNCHSNEKQVKGSLALDDLEEMGEFQIKEFSLIKPGNPEESDFLLRMTMDQNESDFMPRKAGPLPKKELDLIEKWIREGAIVDAENLTEKEQAFLKENGAAADPEMVKEEYLNWTSSEGKNIEARFMGIIGGNKVKLLMKTGKSYEVPFSRLSKESIAQAQKLSAK